MRLRTFSRSSVLTVALLCFQVANAADWPRFRGPNGTGVAAASALPAELGPDRNLVWRIEVPAGSSSPIISGKRIFLTAHEGDQRLVLCLDRGSGKVLWRKGVTQAREEYATKPNDPATPTPVTDGHNVFALFPEFGLVSYGPQGTERWKVPLGPFQSVHGIAGSPVLVDGMVMVLIDQTEGSYLAAFDAADGSAKWKTERLSGFIGGYSTPVIYRPEEGPSQIIASGPWEVVGYQAATGEKLWWAGGLTNVPVSVPILDADTLYLSEPLADPPPFTMMANSDADKDGKLSAEEMDNSGMARFVTKVDRDYGDQDGAVDAAEWKKAFESMRGGGLAALRLSGRGEIPETHLRWRVKKSAPFVPSLLLYDGVIYGVRDGGILAAFNPATGEVLKEGRLKGAIDKYYSSPVAADGSNIRITVCGSVI